MPKAERIIDRLEPAPEPPKANPFKVEQKDRKKFVIDAAGSSEAKNQRLHNEDAFLFDALRGLVCVADGLGGSKNGGLASRMIIEGLQSDAVRRLGGRFEAIINAPADEPIANVSRRDVEQAMGNLLAMTGHRIQKEAPQSDSTASLAKVWTDERGARNLTVAQIGASRIYRLRQGRLERLTRDQSLLEALLDQGLPSIDGSPIMDDDDVTQTFAFKDIEERGKKNRYFGYLADFMRKEKLQTATLEDIRHIVLNGVAMGQPATVQTYDVEPGDMIIAMSDGISDNLSDRELSKTLSGASDATQASQLLRIQASLASKNRSNPRRKDDDMTSAVMLVA